MQKNTMKILWIDVVSQLGGAQLSMFEACNELAARGVKVDVALPPGPLFDKFIQAGFTVYPVSPIRASKKGFAFFKTAAKLLRSPHTVNQIARVCSPTLIHANSLAAFMTTSHVSSEIPVIWHVRDLQSDPHLIRNSLRRARAIITASEVIDENLTSMVPSRYRGKIHLVRNGINPKAFVGVNKNTVREEIGIKPEIPLLGMVAHFVPWKQHDVFIESAALIHQRIPEAQFALIGKDLFNENPRYVKQLKALIAKRNLTDHFHWIEERTTPETIIPALDLLIHPPRHEPFGRIVCEAMVCGVPVVVADTGGPAAIVTDRKTGRHATNGSAESFAEAAIELLEQPETCATITASARDHILRYFTVERIGQELKDVYAEVLRTVKEEKEYHPDRD